MIIGVLVYILSVMNLFPNCLPDRDIRENILKVHEILYAFTKIIAKKIHGDKTRHGKVYDRFGWKFYQKLF